MGGLFRTFRFLLRHGSTKGVSRFWNSIVGNLTGVNQFLLRT